MKPQKAKDAVGLQNTPLSAADLVNTHSGHMTYFDDLWARGKENELYLRGKNLSGKQEDDYYNQGRIPFPNAATADKLQRIISTERNSRTNIKAIAKNPKSEIIAEILNFRLKRVREDSEMDYTRSEIFTSGVSAMYGVGEITVGYNKKGRKVIKIDKVDYQNMIWDSNARRYDKADGTFMAKRKKVYRLDIKRDYGKEIAEQINISDSYWGRKINNYWGIPNQSGERDYDVIILFEHYQKVLRDFYYVIFKGQIVSKETSSKDANEILRMLKMPYLASGQEVPRATVVKKVEDGFDKYTFVQNAILEYEQTDLEDYPFEIYQAFNFEDEIWCMTDILKPKNKFMDKLISQVDYAFGIDVKQPAEIVEPWLHEGISIEEAQRRYKEGELVPVNRPGALNLMKGRGANPEWVKVYEILKQDLTEYSGGPIFSGVQPGLQRESKEAVAMKLKQQELIANLFVDNLQRWELGLFKKTLWFLEKYDDEETIIRTEGGNLSPEMLQILQENGIYVASDNFPGVGYIVLNQTGKEGSYLKDYDVNLELSEENTADSQRQMEWGRMIEAAKYMPDLMLSPTYKKLAIERIGSISYEDKVKVIGELEKIQQAQAKSANQDKQIEQGIDQQKVNIGKARVLTSQQKILTETNNNGRK